MGWNIDRDAAKSMPKRQRVHAQGREVYIASKEERGASGAWPMLAILVMLGFVAEVSMPLVAIAQTSNSAAGLDEGMRKMHASIQALEEQMETMHSTSDPVERERLMSEHMTLMKDVISKIRAEMSTLIKLGGESFIAGKRAPNDPYNMRLMENYAKMLQSMLDQIAQHMDMMNAHK